MARTIQSPGVEINEIDLSLRPVIPTGTSVLIPGFATQGPTDEVFEVTSLSEFEQVYGTPTNAAERYMYHSAKAVFNSSARVLTTRLPYGSGAGLNVGDSYSALFYPVHAYLGTDNWGSPAGGAFPGTKSGIEGVSAGNPASPGTAGTPSAASFFRSISSAGDDTLLGIGRSLSGLQAMGPNGQQLDYAQTGYVFGKPTLVKLDESQYNTLQQQNFKWRNHVVVNPTFTEASTTWEHAGMVITNKSRTTINDKYEGLYIGITDNSQFNPANDFDSIRTVNNGKYSKLRYFYRCIR